MNEHLLQKNIIKYRTELGYSKENIAEICDVSVDEVNNWEISGKTPSLEGVLTLSKLYNVSIDDLLGKFKLEYPWSKSNIFSYIIGIILFLSTMLPLLNSDEYGYSAIDLFDELFRASAVIYLLMMSASLLCIILNVFYIKNSFQKENQFRILMVTLYTWIVLSIIVLIFWFGFFNDLANSMLILFSSSYLLVNNFIKYDRAAVLYKRHAHKFNIKRIISNTSIGLFMSLVVINIVNGELSEREPMFFIYMAIGIVVTSFIPFLRSTFYDKRFLASIHAGILPLAFLVITWIDEFRSFATGDDYSFIIFSFIVGTLPIILINYDIIASKIFNREEL